MAKTQELFSEDKLRIFGEDIIEVLTILLKRAGKEASGKLINSLTYKLQEEAKEIKILIEAEDYLEYVDSGRKAGTWPPVREIERWCGYKGIDKEAAWPIAHKIWKFGIKPTDVFEDMEQIITRAPLNELEEDLVRNIEDTIVKKFNIK